MYLGTATIYILDYHIVFKVYIRGRLVLFSKWLSQKLLYIRVTFRVSFTN